MTVPVQPPLPPLLSLASCPAVWENKVITGGSCRQTAQRELFRAWFSKMPPLVASESPPPGRAWPGDTDGDKERVSWQGECGPSFPSGHTCHLSFGHHAPAHTGPPQGLLSSLLKPLRPPRGPLAVPATHLLATKWRPIGGGEGGWAIRSHVTVGHRLWGQGQTKSNKMTSEAPVHSKTLGAFLSYFLVNYFLINNKAIIAATGKLKK